MNETVFFSPGVLFEALSFRYVGPIQGHRVDVLLETFENVKGMLERGEVDGQIAVVCRALHAGSFTAPNGIRKNGVSADMAVRLLAIRTNEELQIAREPLAVVRGIV